MVGTVLTYQPHPKNKAILERARRYLLLIDCMRLVTSLLISQPMRIYLPIQELSR